jgi:hypothetical protein
MQEVEVDQQTDLAVEVRAGVQHGTTQWERAMMLRKWIGGEEMQPEFAQFVCLHG